MPHCDSRKSAYSGVRIGRSYRPSPLKWTTIRVLTRPVRASIATENPQKALYSTTRDFPIHRRQRDRLTET